ncbi:single-stranded-DNA-specific exonuclease RecJ [Luminiphilus sp.]|nr:single-stranded-DNA-specific exonuclease RecJ [Luminiphilus sp.]MDA9710876.1 single-stranded-DNA-specific exonuclease RecJ [Luminiphilus sp.]
MPLNGPLIRRREVGISAELQAAALPAPLKRIYANRGITNPAELLLTLDQLHPPQQLKGVAEAAELLADAVEGNGRVLIVGDFDADGATSSAMAVSVLQQMGLREVAYLVPNRFEFGYGLTTEIVELAAAQMPDLIVTVDNGISSVEGVAAAQAMGISVLVTDHHLPGEQLPSAEVIVNPNQPGCAFPSKALAGVGVMFYVLSALRAELRRRVWFDGQGPPEPNLGDALDLVALGTVADVVPLDRNNRILVAAGLARIRSGRARPGIEALFEVAGKDHRQATASDLGFIVGPRLNAAGRLDDMSIGIECLLAESSMEARECADKLHRLNRERRDIEQSMEQDAVEHLASLELDSSALPFAMVLFDPSWHQGVIGILASRVRERVHRPTVIFADVGAGMLKGSGRSIPGLHLRDALDLVATRRPGLLDKFGGHAMAAGLTLAKDDLQSFEQALEVAVAEMLNHVPPQVIEDSDGALGAGDLGLALAESLSAGGPWGQHFPEPAFDGLFDVRQYRIVGEKHLKLTLAAQGLEIDAIAFNVDVDDWKARPAPRIHALYRLDINEYRGERKPQLIIQSFWPSEPDSSAD